jgi:NADH-quinone oxidoreductase subunit A
MSQSPPAGVTGEPSTVFMVEQLQQYVPVGLLLLVAIGFATGMVLAPLILGKPRVHDPIKDSAYECGLPPMADAHTRFSVKFYLIAMLFIIFDIEVVFMLGWGAVFRDMIKPVAEGGIGIKMLLGAVLFLGILEVGHIYAWKKGALDWAPRKEHLPEPKPTAAKVEKKPKLVAS